MNRLFIIRHGNTFAPGEPARRIGSRTDLQLVASGKAQARALGRWFKDRAIPIDRAYAGPLRRSRDTARAILDQQTSPPTLTVATWLDEIDHGPDEGAEEALVLRRVGVHAIAAWDRYATPPPGWIVDAPQRLAAWRALFEQRPAGNTLLVTSNGAARFAVLACAGAADRAHLKLRTGALGIVDMPRDAPPRLTCWDLRPNPAAQ